MSLSNSNIPFKRLFVEGLVIVISILLAFAIDAWWEHQQERDEELAVLNSVLADVSHIQSQLEWLIPYNQGIRDASSQIYELSSIPPDAVDHDVLENLLAMSTWHNGGNGWKTPAIDSLTFGGDLKIIRSQEIRTAISGLASDLDSAQVYEAADWQFFTEWYEPYIRKHANLHQIFSVQTELPAGVQGSVDSPLGSVEAPVHDPIDLVVLLAEQEFRNLLTQRWGNIWTILNYGYHPMLVKLDSTVTLLEQEIASLE